MTLLRSDFASTAETTRAVRILELSGFKVRRDPVIAGHFLINNYPASRIELLQVARQCYRPKAVGCSPAAK